MATTAEKVARKLKMAGVQYVFGIPGGPSLSYMEALRNEGIEFVLVKNEASGGFMATVYAELTGKISVCHATYGPGATNLSTGVGCAYLDRVPLLALTSEMSDKNRNRIVQMNIDHQDLFKPITKWTTRLKVDNVNDTFDKALKIAYSEVPGPVHIGLPSDIADKESSEEIRDEQITGEKAKHADKAALKRMGDVFSQAKRPLLAVGLSAIRNGLHNEVVKIAEKFDVPVVLTPMAKGMIQRDHRNYLGVVFHALSNLLNPVIEKADLIVGIGYDPIEFNYEDWMPRTKLLHLDSVEADIDMDVEVMNVAGSLDYSLENLLNLPVQKNDWDYSEIAEVKERLERALRPSSDRMTPSEALDVLREVLPEDGIMTCDVGGHTHLIGQLWKTPAPKMQIMTNGWSSMGFGVPAAIGAKLAKPDKKVVGVTGDGGFLMMLGELITARRLGLNVVIVIMKDNNLSLIDVKQSRRKLERYGVELYKGDFIACDHLLGVPVKSPDSAEKLRQALKEAFQENGPVVIEALVNGKVYDELIARR